MAACPTLQVRILATGYGPVTINAEDFRDDLHERWEHMRALAPTAEPEACPEPVEEVRPGPAKPPKRRG